ncbi:MAG: hypothetical protein IPP07_28025 [Holophagales bacterium]|nr:hypothetical protein [Holophagales bacterium]
MRSAAIESAALPDARSEPRSAKTSGVEVVEPCAFHVRRVRVRVAGHRLKDLTGDEEGALVEVVEDRVGELVAEDRPELARPERGEDPAP